MKYEISEHEVRYYAGIEHPDGITLTVDNDSMGNLWKKFFKDYFEVIPKKFEPSTFIGLECFPPDYKEVKVYDYYAMVQTTTLIEHTDKIVTMKLPKGEYITFLLNFSKLRDEIQRVYRFVKVNNIRINHGFDVEEYLSEEDYAKENAKIKFSLLVMNDD